ncbi:MFS transporter [Actinomadura violacea]|uniref:MFS transporter n=1 Tax=Actinomadura violacea TaxID=2819934 RepID=A0ABS3RMB4_9ACTN|nr:MFS transporter [Actinomadura violacea]MBO2457876.1 MFS transporter [Actinomadura violacea]
MGRLAAGRRAASERAGAARGLGGHRRALTALVLADVAFAYQQTAVVPVIPVIEKELGVAQAWGAWLLSGYLLVATVAAPVLGRLADRHGRRAMLLLGLGMFLLGSVAAAVAPDAVVLIAARAVQGIGGAVFPLSLSIVREEFPGDRVGSATGVLTGAFGIGTALGFATSGALTEAVSWHLVFAVGAAVVALAMPLVVRWVPARPGPSRGALDVPGALLLSAVLALVLVGLTLLPEAKGATWALPGGLIAAGLAAGAVWFRRENRVAEPLIDLRTLRSPAQVWTNGVTLAIGYTLFGTFYLVPQLVGNGQEGFGAGTGTVGLYLLPLAAGQILGGPAARTLQKGGTPRRPLAAGMALLAAGTAACGAIGGSSRPGFLAAAFVVGCGAGLTISASGTLVSVKADEEHAGVSTSLNSTVRRVGGGLGSQASAAILILVGSGRAGWLAAFGLAAAFALVSVPFAARVPLSGPAAGPPPGLSA